MVFPTTALLKRELRATLRSHRAYLLLVVTTGLIFVVVGTNLYFLDAALGFGVGAIMGSYVLGVISVGLYIAMLLCIPPMAASTIVSERTMGNYDLLMTSLIRPTGILFGKMAHIAGFYMLLVVAVLPLVGVCYFFVGVEWRQLLMVAAALFTGAVTLCSLGLFVSTVSRSTREAVFGTYFLTLLFQGGAVPLALIMVQNPLWSGYVVMETRELTEWITSIALPARALSAALDSTGASGKAFAGNLLYQGAWMLTFTGLAAVRLGRPWQPATPGAARFWRRGGRPPHAGRARAVTSIPAWKNPVGVKEVRSSRLGHGTPRALLWMTLFGGCLIINLAYFPFGSPPSGEVHAVLFTHLLIMLILAPTTIAAASASECERETADMLRMTLLTPYEVAWGKFRAALSQMLTLYTAPIAALLVTAYFVPLQWFVFLYFVQMAALIFFTLTVAGVGGALCQRTGTALVNAYAAVFALLVVLPWIALTSVSTEPPWFVVGLYPVTLLIPWQPGNPEVEGILWALLFTPLYGLGFYSVYWRAQAFTLAREPLHGTWPGEEPPAQRSRRS